MFEDDLATTPHRSHFDTERCAAPTILPPPPLEFPGGSVALPKPTRADLVLSARQWATAIREELIDGQFDQCARAAGRVIHKVNRLDAVLKELAES